MESFVSPPPSPTEKEPTRKIEGRLWFKVTGLLSYNGMEKNPSPRLRFSLASTKGRGQRPLPETGKARLAIGYAGGTKGALLPGHKLPHAHQSANPAPPSYHFPRAAAVGHGEEAGRAKGTPTELLYQLLQSRSADDSPPLARAANHKHKTGSP